MKKTVEISGKGGDHELKCQSMLEYVCSLPKFYTLQKRRECLLEKHDDATGAMIESVLAHYLVIARAGRDEWLKIAQDLGDRVYDFDGTLASVLKGRTLCASEY